MTSVQMILIILALAAISVFITRAYKSEQRHKERMEAKKMTPEAVNLQPPAKQSRVVTPEIIAELNAMSEALDISRYALEASMGMRRVAWQAQREARQSDFVPNRQSGYETSEGGQMEHVYSTNGEIDLDNWHFSDN